MSSETTTYNVYLALFSQEKAPDHEAIALVPAQNKNQGAGRFYHFQLPKEQLANFESFASALKPPYDPRVLTESNPDPPAPDCSTWIADVLAEARRLAGH
ncbi:uncharacterized protein BDV14DRAFT_204128 [Aspergillus stella-maris]|uniref:uncharacterized protein n=1 Tax=Aspergillus stella-maris TaxID=1810926 RepID=UPI003CCE343A